MFSDADLEEMWKTCPEFAPPPSVVRKIAMKAAALLAARTGDMEQEGKDLGTVIAASDMTVRSEAAVRLSQALAARGASAVTLEQHVSDLEKSLEQARKDVTSTMAERDQERSIRITAQDALEAARKERDEVTRENEDSLNCLAAARQDAQVWRERVEKAAEALSDVLQGEVGRLDLLSRITEVKRERDAALADNAALVEGLRALVSGLDAEVTYTKDMEKDMRRMGHEKADIDGVRQRLTALARVGHFRSSSDLLTTTHPGAALLERVKRLEEIEGRACAAWKLGSAVRDGRYKAEAAVQFLLNGRWGTCGECPRDHDGFPRPERCVNTTRHDHNIPTDH